MSCSDHNRSNHRTAHIPVVALTAHDVAGELQRATSAGCAWFVPKPCPPDALVTEIRRGLGGKYRRARLKVRLSQISVSLTH